MAEQADILISVKPELDQKEFERQAAQLEKRIGQFRAKAEKVKSGAHVALQKEGANLAFAYGQLYKRTPFQSTYAISGGRPKAGTAQGDLFQNIVARTSAQNQQLKDNIAMARRAEKERIMETKRAEKEKIAMEQQAAKETATLHRGCLKYLALHFC